VFRWLIITGCGDREEMRSLFDPIIDRIIELIEHQVMTVSQGPQRVNVCEGFPPYSSLY
jgi:hypothetical protein